jgi:type IV secretion system protein VirD4
MDKKKKLILSSMIFLLGSISNMILTMNLHLLLKREIRIIKLFKTQEIIKSLVSSKEHLLLFLLFEAVILLIAVFYFVANHKPYQSDLTIITPMIKTPVSAGQNQFGSARWLNKKEINENFKSFTLNKNNENMILLENLAKLEIEDMNVKLIEKENKKENKEENKKDKNLIKIKKIESGGIVLGMEKIKGKEKIYYIDDDVHTLCIGATRSGKTRSIVLQTIGVLGLSGESMIISDPKAELYHYTEKYLKNLNYEVIVIDFKNPLKSNNYNFLQPIIDSIDNDNVPKAIEATWDLTASLVPEDSHSEKIWSNGEASIIAASIIAVVYDNKKGRSRKFQNMTNVYFFIAEMCKVVKGKMPLTSYIENLNNNHPARGLLSISEVAPSKTRGSFFTSALTTLRLFTNPLIYSMTNKSDFDMNVISKKKIALFIILPDEKRTYYSLASLFVNQMYMALINVADSRGGRLKNRVNFILDEYGNFTKIADFATKLTVAGGRGIRFNLFIQGFSQLDEVYGKEVANIIKGNCENWIYLQSDDLSTLEEISKKLGNYTVSTYSLSSSHAKFSNPSTSHSTNLTHRALLTVDEIKLISRPFVLITSRVHPVILKSPDLTHWEFNNFFALGDKEHNRKIRQYRELKREEKKEAEEVELWNIWEFHKEIEMGKSYMKGIKNMIQKQKFKKKLITAFWIIQMLFLNVQSVFADGIGNSKLATGTEALITDTTIWLMVIAPIVGGLLVIYFFIRRSGSDEQDQKRWNNRITTAIVSTIGAILGSAIINLIAGYYL